MKIRLKNPVKFQELLIREGFTKRGLGRAAKIAESYAVQIVSGYRNPGPQVAKRICSALNVDFDDIFYIQGAYKNNNGLDLNANRHRKKVTANERLPI